MKALITLITLTTASASYAVELLPCDKWKEGAEKIMEYRQAGLPIVPIREVTSADPIQATMVEGAFLVPVRKTVKGRYLEIDRFGKKSVVNCNLINSMRMQKSD